MSNAVFGWQNNLLGASLDTPDGVPGLYVDNLKNDQGSPATAWQTQRTAAVFIANTQSAASTWRAFCLARTNLTSGASVRWLVGTLLACRGSVTVPTDTNAGAISRNTTRLGPDPVPSPGGPGVIYRHGSGSAYVGKPAVYVAYAGESLSAGVWLRRTGAGGSAGAVVRADTGGQTFIVPMSAVPGDDVWRYYLVKFVAPSSGSVTVYFIVDAGAGDYSIAGGKVEGRVAYDSGFVPAGVRPGFGQSVHVAPAPVAGEAVRLDITDPTNPDGFINVPLAYAGPVWQPATNIAYDTSLGRDDATDETTTRGGAEFPTLQWTRRRWDVSLQGIRASELWPSVMELDRAARTGQNVLFVPDPAGADVAREAVFGRLRSLGDVTYPFGNGDRRAWRARITERL